MGYLTNCMPEDPHSFRDFEILLSIGCCFIPVKSFHNLAFFTDPLKRPWTMNYPKTSLDLRKRLINWAPEFWLPAKGFGRKGVESPWLQVWCTRPFEKGSHITLCDITNGRIPMLLWS